MVDRFEFESADGYVDREVCDEGEYVRYDDYAALAAVTKKLLESMRTGVQLSFKELDEIERMLK